MFIVYLIYLSHIPLINLFSKFSVFYKVLPFLLAFKFCKVQSKQEWQFMSCLGQSVQALGLGFAWFEIGELDVEMTHVLKHITHQFTQVSTGKKEG